MASFTDRLTGLARSAVKLCAYIGKTTSRTTWGVLAALVVAYTLANYDWLFPPGRLRTAAAVIMYQVCGTLHPKPSTPCQCTFLRKNELLTTTPLWLLLCYRHVSGRIIYYSY